jgi:predicted MFS family arabinose efflux permease
VAITLLCERAASRILRFSVLIFAHLSKSVAQIGFHVFFTVMSVILKDKFKFAPNDYSNYFAFVGLFYALSQLLSKRIINSCAADPTWMVVACTFFLMLVFPRTPLNVALLPHFSDSLGSKFDWKYFLPQILHDICFGQGRLVTALTSNIYIMYLGVILSIAALGVLNNAINTTVTRISEAGNVGGLMGVLDTAEKLAGVVGPTVGGVLYAWHALAPVAAVTAGYLLMMGLVSVAFPRFLVPTLRAAVARATADAHPKRE